MPSMVPFAAAADRLTPFFFFSSGGPIGVGAGVVSAAGVAAFESDALSTFEAAVDTTSALGLAGDSLISEVSFELLESGD